MEESVLKLLGVVLTKYCRHEEKKKTLKGRRMGGLIYTFVGGAAEKNQPVRGWWALVPEAASGAAAALVFLARCQVGLHIHRFFSGVLSESTKMMISSDLKVETGSCDFFARAD